VNTPETALTQDEEALETQEDTGGLRFDDPYWDDAFCAWWDPSLRTCCS
jgi:hypothetical protein